MGLHPNNRAHFCPMSLTSHLCTSMSQINNTTEQHGWLDTALFRNMCHITYWKCTCSNAPGQKQTCFLPKSDHLPLSTTNFIFDFGIVFKYKILKINMFGKNIPFQLIKVLQVILYNYKQYKKSNAQKQYMKIILDAWIATIIITGHAEYLIRRAVVNLNIDKRFQLKYWLTKMQRSFHLSKI